MANQITEVRTALNQSQAGLAALLHVDRSTVTRWENETTAIPPLVELALAELVRRHGPRKRAKAA